MSTPLRERPDAPLGTLIFRAGLLPAETIESALEEGVKTGKRLGEILTERGLISEVDLARLLAGQKGLDFVTLREQIVDPTAAALFTEEQARLFRALPYSFDGELPVVAIADPTDEVLMRNIREALGRDDARFVVSARGELAEIAADVYSRPLPPAAATAPAEPEPEAEAEPEAEPEAEAEAKAPAGYTNGAGHVGSDLMAHAAPAEPEPGPEAKLSALPEPERDPAAFQPEPGPLPEPAGFEPEPEPLPEPEPPALQVPVPAEPAFPGPAAPPLPEPLPAALAEPFPSPAVAPAELPEPAPLETPQPVAFESQAPPEQPVAPEPIAEAEASSSEPAGYSTERPAVAEPLRVVEPAPMPAPAPNQAPALEPPATFEPPASAEPVPLPQPPAPPPTPYPPAAVQPEPASGPAPEPPATVEPTSAAPSLWLLSIRLTNGERVEGGDFPDEDSAKQKARTIMAQIADADSGEWPFVNGRFLKPETIVSVDIDELAAGELT